MNIIRPMLSAKVNFFLLVAILILVTGSVWAFYLYHSSPTTTYMTEIVKKNDIEKKVVVIGTVAASQVVTVGSQASGQIRKLHAQLGVSVTKGQLIAEIDSTTQMNDLNTSRALLKSYEAQLGARKIALNIARIKYFREIDLRKNDATSQESYENAENEWAKAKAEAAETESLIMQAQISVETAKANLGYTRIVAPITGIVISMPVEEGQTINASQVTPTIIQLADLTVMSLKIQISEADITKVRPGLPILFNILSDPNVQYTTILSSIDPADMSTTNDTKNSDESGAAKKENAIYYYGRALVNNSDGTLRINMTTRNSIVIDMKKDVICVPNVAIYERDRKKYVRILLDERKVTEVEIQTGIYDNLRTEVMKGLLGGERVITSEVTSEELVDIMNKKIE